MPDPEGNLTQPVGILEDGSVRASGLLLGYCGDVREYFLVNAPVVGTNTVTGAGVPAGELWVITQGEVLNATRALIYAAIGIWNGVNFYANTRIAPCAQWNAAGWRTWVVLQPGDAVRGVYAGCQVNDVLVLNYVGFKCEV